MRNLSNLINDGTLFRAVGYDIDRWPRKEREPHPMSQISQKMMPGLHLTFTKLMPIVTLGGQSRWLSGQMFIPIIEQKIELKESVSEYVMLEAFLNVKETV